MDTKQIYIDKPCSENWDAMTPNEQGRHCMKCCKTVVDFSTWETQDIFTYLNNSTKSVCGQINAKDVIIPIPKEPYTQKALVQNILKSSVSFLKKIAAVIVLCFGITNTRDVFAQQPKRPDKQQQPQRPMILGGIRMPPKVDTVQKKEEDTMIRGEMVPQDTAKSCNPEKIKGKIKVNDQRKKK